MSEAIKTVPRNQISKVNTLSTSTEPVRYVKPIIPVRLLCCDGPNGHTKMAIIPKKLLLIIGRSLQLTFCFFLSRDVSYSFHRCPQQHPKIINYPQYIPYSLLSQGTETWNVSQPLQGENNQVADLGDLSFLCLAKVVNGSYFCLKNHLKTLS